MKARRCSAQIGNLYPGDGITSTQPLIMEEYGQGWVTAAATSTVCWHCTPCIGQGMQLVLGPAS